MNAQSSQCLVDEDDSDVSAKCLDTAVIADGTKTTATQNVDQNLQHQIRGRGI